MVDRWWYQPGAGARVCEEACGLSRTREIDRPSRRVRSKTQNSQYVSRQYKYASPNLPNLRKQLVMQSNPMAAEQASPPKRRRGGRSCALCSSRCGHAATRMIRLYTS